MHTGVPSASSGPASSRPAEGPCSRNPFLYALRFVVLPPARPNTTLPLTCPRLANRRSTVPLPRLPHAWPWLPTCVPVCQSNRTFASLAPLYLPGLLDFCLAKSHGAYRNKPPPTSGRKDGAVTPAYPASHPQANTTNQSGAYVSLFSGSGCTFDPPIALEAPPGVNTSVTEFGTQASACPLHRGEGGGFKQGSMASVCQGCLHSRCIHSVDRGGSSSLPLGVGAPPRDDRGLHTLAHCALIHTTRRL